MTNRAEDYLIIPLSPAREVFLVVESVEDQSEQFRTSGPHLAIGMVVGPPPSDGKTWVVLFPDGAVPASCVSLSWEAALRCCENRKRCRELVDDSEVRKVLGLPCLKPS